MVATVASGPIEVRVFAEPSAVHLDRDILLTFRVSAPSNVEVRLPPLENRLKGFVLNGAYSCDGSGGAAGLVKDYCFRLTPTLAEEYRIAPMAITWANRAQETVSEGWFATHPIVFQAAAVADGPPAVNIHDIAAPLWIYPPFRTIALWLLAFVAAAGLFYLLWWSSRRIHRAIQLRRMSPRERAIYELKELLAQDLIGRRKIKEFYLALTMIVRRYIERAHAIRAPEQTTDEFLVAATKNPDFTRDVVVKLRAFLSTADLVKFAAYRPESEVIDQTLVTARDYIETDEQAQAGLKEGLSKNDRIR